MKLLLYYIILIKRICNYINSNGLFSKIYIFICICIISNTFIFEF